MIRRTLLAALPLSSARDRPAAGRHAEESSQLLWGAAGIVAAALALALVAMLYAVPFGRHTHIADMRNSGGLRVGDEVRVAGIKVGTVSAVRVSGDHVEVGFGVDDDVAVGDASAVEAKLLTPIGGHYLALLPAGAKPLGRNHIPPERTATPFELTDVLEQSVPALHDVDGATLRATVAQVNQALHGQPDAIRNLLGNVSDLTGLLADRTEQLDRALTVTDEYVGAVAADEAVLLNFVRTLGVVAVELGTQKQNVAGTFQLLRRLATVAHRPIMAYASTIEPVITDLEQVFAKILADQSHADQVIATIAEFVGKLAQILGADGVTIDQSDSVITGVPVCVPAPERNC